MIKMENNTEKRETETCETDIHETETIDPRQYPPGYTIVEDTPVTHKKRFSEKYGVREGTFIALTPFIYVALGLIFGGKFWAFGWVIIPVAAILFKARIDNKEKFIALTPFIYLLLGFFFGWWVWGWMIIPVSAILLKGIYRRA